MKRTLTPKPLSPVGDSRSALQLATPCLGVHLGVDLVKRRFPHIDQRKLADGVGFEPTRRLHVCRFSRPVPSTTRPPIHLIELQRISGSCNFQKSSLLSKLLPKSFISCFHAHPGGSECLVEFNRRVLLHRLGDVGV
jgi:hypothetical protein